MGACSSDDAAEGIEPGGAPDPDVAAAEPGDAEDVGWVESFFGSIEPGPQRGTYQPPGDKKPVQGDLPDSLRIQRGGEDPAPAPEDRSLDPDSDQGWLGGLSLFGGDDDDDDGRPGSAPAPLGFRGIVVSDEPGAALVGRDILAAGGTAADAAAALYLALSVTYPAAASLGGGGVCVVHDQPGKRSQVLDFLPGLPPSLPPNASRPNAIPGAVRGVAALHRRFGRLPWADIVRPAERLARDGAPVSRMLADDLVLVSHAFLDDPEARRIFADRRGTPLIEGDQLRQLDLAVVLTRLRMRGAKDFYDGQNADALARGAAAAGGQLDRVALRDYRARWLEPVAVRAGDITLLTAPPPVYGGVTAAEIIALARPRFATAGANERPHLFVESAMRAFADRAFWRTLAAAGPLGADAFDPARPSALMVNYNPMAHTAPDALDPAPSGVFENPAASGFVTMDGRGNIVVCMATTYNLFGTGKVASGTGIVLAAAPVRPGLGPAPLTPLIGLRADRASDPLFAGAASGGAAAPTALAWTLIRMIEEGMPLGRAIAAARLHHNGRPDRVLIETEGLDIFAPPLERRGHRIEPIDSSLGQVNAISCPSGYGSGVSQCVGASDPRLYGVAIRVGR